MAERLLAKPNKQQNIGYNSKEAESFAKLYSQDLGWFYFEQGHWFHELVKKFNPKVFHLPE